MSNVPDIRFKGFTDAWEQRELGEVSEIIGGGTPNTSISEYWDGDINWFSPVEIGDQIYIYESQKKITELGMKKSSAKLLPKGTILFTSRAGIGNMAILSVPSCTNQGFQSIVPNHNVLNAYFIFSLKDRFKIYGEKNGAGSTFIEVSGKVMRKMKLDLPSIEEQSLIGQHFEHLDKTITLLQRELDSLKLIKGSLLHKLFPGINEQNPCIRLSNFKEDWKSIKLADISNRVTRKNKELESKTPLTISALYGLVDQTKYFSKQIASEKLENYILIKKGEFAYNKSYSNGYPFGAVKRLDNYNKGVLSSLYIVFELLSIVDSNFMKYYFETKLWHKEVQKKSAEGARNHGLLNITATDFLSLKIKMPNDINEQIKIGEYFNSLDLKIDKLNREIILYQKMKKGFLQKLFPKGG